MNRRWYQNINWAQINWKVTLFIIGLPIVTALTLPFYLSHFGFSWTIWLFAILFAGATTLSITAGYHRLFSHRSYDANPLVRFFFLLIGASAFQNSALKWSSDHRVHHSKVDTDEDPYNIHKGFWYAHMGWLFLELPTDHKPNAIDLERDPLIAFQHRHYLPIAFFVGFIAPALIGLLLGDWIGGLLVAGGLRIVLTQQTTFFVNSLCHLWGTQTYSDKVTARDSLVVAVLTHGEGYHNFHHLFQNDYRNGVRWYHWDPTKWLIKCMSLIGFAKRLRVVSNYEILRARLKMEELRMSSRGFSTERLASIRERILTTQAAMKRMRDDYVRLKSEMKSVSRINEWNEASKAKLDQIKTDMQQKKIEFKQAWSEWKTCLRTAAIMIPN